VEDTFEQYLENTVCQKLVTDNWAFYSNFCVIQSNAAPTQAGKLPNGTLKAHLLEWLAAFWFQHHQGGNAAKARSQALVKVRGHTAYKHTGAKQWM
jgi:hypothetical protein